LVPKVNKGFPLESRIPAHTRGKLRESTRTLAGTTKSGAAFYHVVYRNRNYSKGEIATKTKQSRVPRRVAKIFHRHRDEETRRPETSQKNAEFEIPDCALLSVILRNRVF